MAIRKIAPQYENVLTQDIDLPINVSLRNNNSDSVGCEFHWHEELEFYYVVSGGVSLLCNGKKEWLYPGDVGFVNWCEPHRGSGFLDETEHYIIQIGTALLTGFHDYNYFSRLFKKIMGNSPSEYRKETG